MKYNTFYFFNLAAWTEIFYELGALYHVSKKMRVLCMTILMTQEITFDVRLKQINFETVIQLSLSSKTEAYQQIFRGI